MKSIKYFTCKCQKCNSMVMFKVDFLDYNEACCLDFKNQKFLKMFNDENEAKNYLALHKKEE